MNILQTIRDCAKRNPDRVAFYGENESLTYREIETYSNRLAAYLEEWYQGEHSPLVVYGHKSPYMLVCFLACVKSKRAYCPIDISVPQARVQMILDALHAPTVLALRPLEAKCSHVTVEQKIREICQQYEGELSPSSQVEPGDIFYIIFTSGSTGVPKGVQITRSCLENYLEWSVDLGMNRREKEGKVFLNQAPFSFDLSVMDLYTCLACRGTLWTLDKETQNNFSSMMDSLKRSGASVWVSTPSFADICLSDPIFEQGLMENLELFLFCGETLSNVTAEKLHKRFYDAKIMNTYGPTESTVAVTGIEVTRGLNRSVNPLPVGYPKQNTIIEIRHPDGTVCKEEERGEIVILGDTVSAGYYMQPDLTQKAFFTEKRDGTVIRGYHTGDEGYLKEGNLYYTGRMDLQVKLHGYRIELEDIEANILRVEAVQQAVVVPRKSGGKIKSLAAFVIYGQRENSDFETSRKIKEALKEFLPDYMIPKKFIYMDKIPMTINGKADRKYLEGLLA